MPPFGGMGPFASAEQPNVQQPISLIPTTDSMATNGTSDAVAPLTIAGTTVTEDTLPLALTVQETAQVLRFDPRTIRAMVRSGELDGNQKGHAIRISRSSVLDWLRGKRRAPRSRR